MAVITYREALNQALAEEMERDPDVFLMGEEVGVYNGAYKVSKGLLDRFGELRAVDTPISARGGAGRGAATERARCPRGSWPAPASCGWWTRPAPGWASPGWGRARPWWGCGR